MIPPLLKNTNDLSLTSSIKPLIPDQQSTMEERLKSNKHSAGAGVVYTGDGKLLIKLNNTRTPEEDPTNDHHHPIHACQLCLKEFSSAKALGGHMRVHADDRKTEHVRFDSNPRGLYCLTCSLCDKSFPSTKALSGHMRCHPDRDWRGIQPPLPPTTSDDDDQRELIQLTTGWPLTGRRGRGRTATSPSRQEKEEDVDDEFHIAASELLLLAQEKSIDWNSGGDESEYSSAADEETGGGVPKTTWYDKEFDSRVSKMEYSKSNDDGKTRVNNGQNSKNYEAAMDDSEKFRVRKRQKTKSTTEPSTVDSAENYKCSTCNKCFPSHQALGGHRSSHNKFKMVTINSMDAAAAADHDHRYDHASNPNSAVPHQFKICDRVFNTGQAFGGHQRCHYSTRPAATQTHSSSEPKKALLDFDLNEVPNDVDDDCGDRALSASYNFN